MKCPELDIVSAPNTKTLSLSFFFSCLRYFRNQARCAIACAAIFYLTFKVYLIGEKKKINVPIIDVPYFIL